MQSVEEMKAKQAKQLQEDANAFKDKEMAHERDMIILKAKEDRQTKKEVAAIGAMGFDPNKDQDDDGTPDVLEVAKFGVDANIKRRKLQQDDDKLDLDKDKFEHQKKVDKEKLEIDRKKASKPTGK